MADDFRTPRSTAQDMVDETKLSKSMNMMTKGFHLKLHRLVHTKLRHALPPHCNTPKLYARGLLHFASVYMTFESLWGRWAQYESDDAIPLDMAVVLSGLIHMQMPELQRSERLVKDLSTLMQITREDVVARVIKPEGDKLKEFLEHMENKIRAKPHVLVAYAWVFYLALFDGGYWIKSQLLHARHTHWQLCPCQHHHEDSDCQSMGEPQDSGLSFWYIPGKGNGAEVKEEFRMRLAEVDGMLSTQHINDIVLEAREIFRYCTELTKELDDIIEADKKAEANKGPLMGPLCQLYMAVLVLVLGFIVKSVFKF